MTGSRARLSLVVPAITMAAILAAAAPAAGASVPAPGFVDRLVVPSDAATGVVAPTAARFHPLTGDLWVAEKGTGVAAGTARVRVRDAATGQVSTAITRPCVDSRGERGLLDLAFDPDFAASRFVYLFYTRRYESSGPCSEAGQIAGSRNVVARLVEVGGMLASETVILRGPLSGSFSTIHNGGSLAFLGDGTMLVSMGDGGAGPTSQNPARNLGDLRGKILRIARDGSIPSDNPFLAVSGARPEIWAIGFRNPYRITVDPETDTVYIADVGESLWEEIDAGLAGGDYGWPCLEATQASLDCDPPPAAGSLTFPIYAYSHTSASPPVEGGAVVGGPIFRSAAFGPEYEGDYFFADYVGGWIRSARIGPAGFTEPIDLFISGIQGPVDLSVGPDDCLYYTAIVASEIHSICHAGGANGQPSAVAGAAPTSGPAPLEVFFGAGRSSDPDGDPLACSWSLGNGRSSPRAYTSEIYQPGVYEVSLTVDDGRGEPNSTDTAGPLRIVAGNDAPAAAMTAPVDGAIYRAGDVVAFSGLATDPEEGTLGPAAFAWTIVFHHGAHTHPFLGPLRGLSSGSFAIPASGESDPNVAYEVRMEASDSGSPLGAAGRLATTVAAMVRPRVSRLEVAADPPAAGLMIEIDGQARQAPSSIASVAGWPRGIGAPSPQQSGGRAYAFESWSDGGAPAHDVVTPDIDTVYTARFSCPTWTVPRDLAVGAPQGGGIALTWTPSADPCHEDRPGRPGYAIYRGATARPSIGAGSFPDDPAFDLVGTSETPEFSLAYGAGFEVYLVLDIGRDGLPGPNGHY